jgi:hypothetical protein
MADVTQEMAQPYCRYVNAAEHSHSSRVMV